MIVRTARGVCFAGLHLFSIAALAEEYFDPGLLAPVNGAGVQTDISRLSQVHQSPGKYRVHVSVNDTTVWSGEMTFYLSDKQILKPCVSRQLLRQWGIDVQSITTRKITPDDVQACADLDTVTDIHTRFDFSQLTLMLDVPQSLLLDDASEESGYADETEWDEGIPAVLTSYQLSGQQSVGADSNDSHYAYLNLMNGLNAGAWRFRDNSTLCQEEGWKSLTHFLETDVRALKAELTLGDASTPGDIFDSMLLRGGQLTSDEQMLPDSLHGYAPVIRGIARTHATVTVTENGYTVLQRSVPPGPFTFSNLSSVTDGGDLQVTVKESDGTESHFTVAYTSVPQLMRQGQTKFSLAAGQYRGAGTSFAAPELVSGTFARGLAHDFTVYGGALLNTDYQAWNEGLGFNGQRLGGMAVDVTENTWHRSDIPRQGQGHKVHWTYQNTLPWLDTSLQLDGNVYSAGYRSLSEWSTLATDESSAAIAQSASLTLNQNAGGAGSIYLTLNKSRDTEHGVSRAFQAGWSETLSDISLSLAASVNRSAGQDEWDKQLSLTLSTSLARWLPASRPSVSYTLAGEGKKVMSHQVSVNGVVNGNDDFTWNGQYSYSRQQEDAVGHAWSAGADYRGSHGEVGIGYTSDSQRYLTYSASGSVLAWQEGVVAGPYAIGSAALVNLPGVSGIPLENNSTISTDNRGNTLLTDLQDYRQNDIRLQTKNVSKDIDFSGTSATVIPTRDAIVMARFSARKGHRLVLSARYHDDYVPFGAEVSLEGEGSTWYTGEQGQVYLNTAAEAGRVHFRWGDNQTCSARFDINQHTGRQVTPVMLLPLQCS